MDEFSYARLETRERVLVHLQDGCRRVVTGPRGAWFGAAVLPMILLR
jgi:hypothetical protein